MLALKIARAHLYQLCKGGKKMGLDQAQLHNIQKAKKYFNYSFFILLVFNAFAFGFYRNNREYYETINQISFLIQLFFAFFAFRLSRALSKPWWILLLLTVLCVAGRMLSLIGYLLLTFMSRKIVEQDKTEIDGNTAEKEHPLTETPKEDK